MTDAVKALAAGWAARAGEVYHFEHIPLHEAKRKTAALAGLHVVETVNWTFADASGKSVHYNRYFALGYAAAVAMAACFMVQWAEVAEDVVNIRPARPEEQAAYWQAWEHFEAQTPAAWPDKAPLERPGGRQ